MNKQRALEIAKHLFGEEWAWVMKTQSKRPCVVGYVNSKKKNIWMGVGKSWQEAIDSARDSELRQLSLRITTLELDKLRSKR